MGNRPTPFAMDKDGKDLFVELWATGIHPMVAICDGIPFTVFGDETGRPYMRISLAIAWHEKEIEASGGKSGNERLLCRLKNAMVAFRDGRFDEL